MKAKRIAPFLLALFLSLLFCITAAFAVPGNDPTGDTSMDTEVSIVDEEKESTGLVSKSLMIKGGIALGVGVVMYVAISIKSRNK